MIYITNIFFAAEQFIYDRNKSSFLSVNEDGEASTIKKPELPELETAKLMSCIETIRNIIGKETISDNDLVKKIIDSNFNSEAVLDEILNDSGNDGTFNFPYIFVISAKL